MFKGLLFLLPSIWYRKPVPHCLALGSELLKETFSIFPLFHWIFPVSRILIHLIKYFPISEMKNVYRGSSVPKKFLSAHLIYLLLCWGAIKCEPCGALWHGCVLWQHRVWPYGRAGVRIFLHMLVAEYPCYTYMLLCTQGELPTAAHSVLKEI